MTPNADAHSMVAPREGPCITARRDLAANDEEDLLLIAVWGVEVILRTDPEALVAFDNASVFKERGAMAAGVNQQAAAGR